MRTIAAFLIAPLVPAAVLVAVIVVMGSDGPGAPLVLARIVALATYPIALLFGVPARLVFRRFGWTSRRSYAAGGLAIGLAAWALFRLAGITRPDPSELFGVLLFTGLAVPTALVFRAIAGAPASPPPPPP